MSECSLSGRGQGHVSNFYIVDLENFDTASRRYTGDVHNSTVVGLFMTPQKMGADSSRHGRVHIVYHALPLSNDEHVSGRPCKIAMLHGHMTLRYYNVVQSRNHASLKVSLID